MNRLEELVGLWIPAFYVKLFCGLILSLLITYITIPQVIKVAHKKHLMDEPNGRSSHVKLIPNLGGIALFYAISICASIFAYELFDSYKFLFASLVILLFVGVMDDIMVMRAYKKLMVQIILSILMVLGSDVRIRSLFGLFGVYELSYWASVLFTIFTFVALINAFNLIDGIDGLAGSYSVLCSIFFGISYYRLGEYNYPLVVLCAVIVGAGLGFLRYNLSNYRSSKIFMGDTGSMILGFLLAFTAICFIDIFIDKQIAGVPRYHLQSAPVIAVAILILPIIDTLNVFTIRVLNKKSPMFADRNHIHHKLLDLGLTHRRSTAYILCYYLIVVMVAYFCRHFEINLLLAIVIGLGFLGAYLPIFILKLKKS